MLLKQIYQSVGLLINRHFEEAHLLVAFIMNLNIMGSFLKIALTVYFRAVHMAGRTECCATVCLQNKV